MGPGEWGCQHPGVAGHQSGVVCGPQPHSVSKGIDLGGTEVLTLEGPCGLSS